MKLRNKKTGEIGYTGLAVDGLLPVAIEGRVAGNAEQRYRTLAELNAEWEDVPEQPKGIIKVEKSLVPTCVYSEYSTEEEAENAVAKLKAFTRLKDKGFKFKGYTDDSGDLFSCQVIRCSFDDFGEESRKDLNLLFGGEE